MKRLALFAVLAAAVGSNDAADCLAQSVQGHSKFTMKDPTRQDPTALAARGGSSSGPAAEYSVDDAGASQAMDGSMGSAYEYGAMPTGQTPYMPAGYTGYPHGMQVAYPGYAPTRENMLYGGSPYPQMMPASYGSPADFGYDGGCSECGSPGCAAGHCDRSRHGHHKAHHWIIGYDATEDWISGRKRRGYAIAEGLKFFPKGANAPPLLTTSPVGTAQDQAGVIGAPGTEVLIGGSEFDDESLYGGRVALGFWTMGAEYIGFEFNYMGFDNGGTTFEANSSFEPDNGGSILAIPFIDATSGAENSLILAYPNFQTTGGVIDTGGAPIDVNGSFALDSDLEIHSAGALMKSVVWVLPDAGWRMFFLGGYRFFWLSDDLDMTSTIEPVGALFGAGSRLEVFDSFDTENQFHGGELGLQTELATGPWSIGIITKVALGNNHQELHIEGETRAIGTGGAALTAGGLFAQPTNIGSFSDNRFAVLPEASVTFGYQLTRCVRLTAGYNFVYLNHVLRAAEQIDRTINPTQFDNGTLVGDARPARSIVENEFWMHGVSTGVEIKW
jgi:hypothetical protein